MKSNNRTPEEMGLKCYSRDYRNQTSDRQGTLRFFRSKFLKKQGSKWAERRQEATNKAKKVHSTPHLTHMHAEPNQPAGWRTRLRTRGWGRMRTLTSVSVDTAILFSPASAKTRAPGETPGDARARAGQGWDRGKRSPRTQKIPRYTGKRISVAEAGDFK
jgi:hypothetical protein